MYSWCESTSSVGGKCLDAAYRLKKNKSKHACHWSKIIVTFPGFLNDFDTYKYFAGKRQIFRTSMSCTCSCLDRIFYR